MWGPDRAVNRVVLSTHRGHSIADQGLVDCVCGLNIGHDDDSMLS